MTDTRIPVNSENCCATAAEHDTTTDKATTNEAIATTKEAVEQTILPRVDIVETPDTWTLSFDLPGATRDDVMLNIEDDTLTVEAPVTMDQPGDALLREFEVTRYRREFRLGEAIDTDNAVAEMRHGVLTLKLPRRRQRVSIPVSLAVSESEA